MGSTIKLSDEHFIDIVIEGNIDIPVVIELLAKGMEINFKLMSKGKPIRTIIDMTKITGFSDTAFAMAKKTFGFTPFDKMAFYGGGEKVKKAMDELIADWPGNHNRTRQFADREEALEWLRK